MESWTQSDLKDNIDIFNKKNDKNFHSTQYNLTKQIVLAVLIQQFTIALQ